MIIGLMIIMSEYKKDYRWPDLIIGIIFGITGIAIFVYIGFIREQDEVLPLFIGLISISITMSFFCIASFADNYKRIK